MSPDGEAATAMSCQDVSTAREWKVRGEGGAHLVAVPIELFNLGPERRRAENSLGRQGIKRIRDGDVFLVEALALCGIGLDRYEAVSRVA